MFYHRMKTERDILRHMIAIEAEKIKKKRQPLMPSTVNDPFGYGLSDTTCIQIYRTEPRANLLWALFAVLFHFFYRLKQYPPESPFGGLTGFSPFILFHPITVAMQQASGKGIFIIDGSLIAVFAESAVSQVCSPYDSAIRADMTIGGTELEGPAPFHNPNGRWGRTQGKYHDGCEFSHLG